MPSAASGVMDHAGEVLALEEFFGRRQPLNVPIVGVTRPEVRVELGGGVHSPPRACRLAATTRAATSAMICPGAALAQVRPSAVTVCVGSGRPRPASGTHDDAARRRDLLIMSAGPAA